MKKISIAFVSAVFMLLMTSFAQAGPGTVEVQTLGDITVRMGAQVRLVPTTEISRDFGTSSDLSKEQEQKAVGIMRKVGVLGSSLKDHLNEAGGALKDGYIRGENRLFFNFAHDQDWDVYFALESDTTLDRTAVDRTDFAYGLQSQQFGIERLNASFNVPFLHSRVNGGWDVKGADVKFGGMIYGDDDPGIGLTGCYQGFKWEAWYIKKDEQEAGYAGIDPVKSKVNPIGPPTQQKGTDRTFYMGKLGYTFQKNTYVEGVFFYDQNYQQGNHIDIDRFFGGLNYKGDYGIFHPMAEFAYVGGTMDNDREIDYDISSYAFFGDLLVDLHETVGIKKFEVHVGGYYLRGDDDPNDDDLEGFTPAVGITRFTPRFGSEQSISHDGNPFFGQILYSMFPAYYGSVRGGGINGGAALDNPGFSMIGGGINAQYGKWTYITHVMAMWFNETEAVENYFSNMGVAGNVDIDSFMGVEWNNEIRYKVFKSVTLKGGAAFLFPGSGAKDITKAVNAYGRDVSFEQGKKSDDVSMRFAAELLWLF